MSAELITGADSLVIIMPHRPCELFHGPQVGPSRSQMEDLQSRGWEAQLSELSEAQKLFIKIIELERTRVQTKEMERSHKINRGDGYSSGHSNNSRDIQNVLTNISVLVTLVGSADEFVRHSAGKTLAVVSEYLNLKHKKSLWSSIPVQLWDAMKFSCKTASTKCMVNVSEQGSSRAEGGASIFSDKSRPETAALTYTSHGEREWGPVVSALEVLRSILKKGSDGNDYLQTYLGFLEENLFILIQNMMPDILCPSLEHELALGAVLQLLHTAIGCLVKTSDEGFVVEPLFIKKVGESIPALARVALLPHRHCPNVFCISSFLRHKFLQLMMRLRKWFHTEHTLAIGCLRALRDYGADLIDFSLSKPSNSQEINSVLGSPFGPTLSNPQDLKKGDKYSMTHLRCRALFLLFKVWLVTANEFGLKGVSTLRIQLVEDSDNEGLATPSNRFPDYNDKLSLDVERCYSMLKGSPDQEQSEPHLKVSGVCDEGGNTSDTMIRRGVANQNLEGPSAGQISLWEEANEAIKEWLKLQSSGFSVEIDQDLSMSLVSLYLDEDDMMIEMLLQLFGVRPLLCSLGEAEPRDCGWVVKALAPLELFHALLVIIAYDHTVLVDFLISQTTGTLFLQYLMQCLRLSINTWPDFQRAGAFWNREASIDIRETRLRVSSDKAMSCLLELKVAVERLYIRNLFPYKPLPLLRRLAMLKELQQRDVEGRKLFPAEAAIARLM